MEEEKAVAKASYAYIRNNLFEYKSNCLTVRIIYKAWK